MRPEHKVVLRETWSKLAPQADSAATLFYSRLFAIDPTVHAIFAGVDMPEQRRKLVLALTLIVQSLDRFESLIPILAQLGRRHARYRVTDRHYHTVGQALLWTLEQGLRSDWTTEVAEAWRAAYVSVSDVMRAASRDSLDAGSPRLGTDWW